jgi:hypothetical protein
MRGACLQILPRGALQLVYVVCTPFPVEVTLVPVSRLGQTQPELGRVVVFTAARGSKEARERGAPFWTTRLDQKRVRAGSAAQRGSTGAGATQVGTRSAALRLYLSSPISAGPYCCHTSSPCLCRIQPYSIVYCNTTGRAACLSVTRSDNGFLESLGANTCIVSQWQQRPIMAALLSA